jgi:hypothetical protein
MEVSGQLHVSSARLGKSAYAKARPCLLVLPICILRDFAFSFGPDIHFMQTQLKSDESISKSFRTGHLEQELQMVQLSASSCSCITNFSVSVVRFAAITLCVLVLNGCLLL